MNWSDRRNLTRATQENGVEESREVGAWFPGGDGGGHHGYEGALRRNCSPWRTKNKVPGPGCIGDTRVLADVSPSFCFYLFLPFLSNSKEPMGKAHYPKLFVPVLVTLTDLRIPRLGSRGRL